MDLSRSSQMCVRLCVDPKPVANCSNIWRMRSISIWLSWPLRQTFPFCKSQCKPWGQGPHQCCIMSNFPHIPQRSGFALVKISFIWNLQWLRLDRLYQPQTSSFRWMQTALRNMLVNCTLQFTTPIPVSSRHQRDAVRREFAPQDWYQNIEERDNRRARACDLYVARLPAVSGQGFGANLIAAPVFEYLRVQTPRIFILISLKSQLPHILAACRNLNMYNLYGDVMSSHCNGIPQSKKRSYCVGILRRFDNGKFAFPAAMECPGLESMLERRASLHRLSGKTRCLPPRSSRTARDNVIRVNQELRRAGPAAAPGASCDRHWCQFLSWQ